MASLAADKHLFYTELAKLLAAGFGVRDAARTMRRSGLPKRQEDWLKRMEGGLDQGRSIAHSLNPDEGLEQSILDAGERSGRISIAFQHLADYFGMMASVRRSAWSAMIYPVFLLHLGVLAGVLPKGLMRGESMASLLSSATLILLAIYAVGVLLSFLVQALLKAAPHQKRVDAFLAAIPLLGKARRSLAMARFTKVYHACILAGMSMEETVRTAGNAAQSGLVSSAATHLQQSLKEGQPLGPAFIANDIFPDAFARSYATAEESGMLDQDLARWSNVFQSDAEQATRTLASAVPKILYALIVIYVVYQIVGFYAGYLDELNRIGTEYLD